MEVIKSGGDSDEVARNGRRRDSLRKQQKLLEEKRHLNSTARSNENKRVKMHKSSSQILIMSTTRLNNNHLLSRCGGPEECLEIESNVLTPLPVDKQRNDLSHHSGGDPDLKTWMIDLKKVDDDIMREDHIITSFLPPKSKRHGISTIR